MSSLTLIRHGQATFYKDHYDELSSLGQKQATALGKYMLEAEMRFDAVYSGPLKRQKQTQSLVQEVFSEKRVSYPEAVLLDEFEEHSGPQAVRRAALELTERDEAYRSFAAPVKSWSAETRKKYFTFFEKFMLEWSRGELGYDDVESWQTFRARVERGVKRVLNDHQRGKRVAVFTSAGPIAATLAYVLGLENGKTMETSWVIRNASFSEFLFTQNRITLLAHNQVPHLKTDGMRTYV